MKECVKEGVLQSYFDGELSLEMMEKVGSHLSSCLACKRAARELENESLLLAQALEPEFSMNVPTEQLRARIGAAIAEKRLLNPVRPSLVNQTSVPVWRGWLHSVADLFALSPQRAFGYAGLAAVILFAITFALVKFRTAPLPKPQEIAGRQQPPAPGPTSSPANSPGAVATVNPSPEEKNPPPRFIPVNHKRPAAQRASANESAHVKLLPGERGYLKTIAALDSSLNSDRTKPMRPALQSEYERNLAMVDRAIAATRNAAKSNPNDPDAAEFMFAAYQTKVDLLNQVADARFPNRQH